MNRHTPLSFRVAKALLAVGVLAAVVVAPAPADATVSYTRTEHYVGGDGGPLLGGTSQCVTRPSNGAVCFGVTWADAVEIHVEDDSGRPVGGIVRIDSDGGWNVTWRRFCGSSGPIPISQPGNALNVFLDAPGDVRGAHWFDGPGCSEVAGVTTLGATSGRVHATFTDH